MVPRFRLFRDVLVVSALLGGAARAYPDCSPLNFEGQASVTVHAHIPDVLPLCYAFSAREGQHAGVEVSKAEHMSFGVESEFPGDESHILGDRRTRFQFDTRTGTYHILVGSDLPHGNTAAFFSLTVTLK